MNLNKLKKLVKLSDKAAVAYNARKDVADMTAVALRLRYIASCTKVAAAVMQITKSLLKIGTRERLDADGKEFIALVADDTANELQVLVHIMPSIISMLETTTQLAQAHKDAIPYYAKLAKGSRFQEMSMNTVDTFIDKITGLIQAGETEDAIGLAEELRQFIHKY